MKIRTKTRHFALLLALLLFIASIAGIGGALRVNASDSSGDLEPYGNYVFPTYVPDSEYIANPDPSLTSLHYFSDYQQSNQIFQTGFVRNYINRNPNIARDEDGQPDAHLHYYTPSEFWTQIALFMSQGEHMNINDAFVIFEVRSGFPPKYLLPESNEEDLQAATQVFDLLKDFFYTLHEQNNCKIMFICGTEEGRFVNYRDFLDYVDIHINMDLYTALIYTTIKRMELVNGGVWGEDTTIVLDVSMGCSWDFFKQLILYFVYKYKDTNAVGDPQDVLDFLHVNVFFYRPDSNTYYDMYSQVPNGYFNEVWLESDYGFAVSGNVTASNGHFTTLINQRGSDKFIELPFDCDNDIFDYYVAIIMRDFILNRTVSLAQYDNWGGACNVTFRPFFFSDEGWLLFPGGSKWQEELEWLQIALILPNLEEVDKLYNFLLSDPPAFAVW